MDTDTGKISNYYLPHNTNPSESSSNVVVFTNYSGQILSGEIVGQVTIPFTWNFNSTDNVTMDINVNFNNFGKVYNGTIPFRYYIANTANGLLTNFRFITATNLLSIQSGYDNNGTETQLNAGSVSFIDYVDTSPAKGTAVMLSIIFSPLHTTDNVNVNISARFSVSSPPL